MDELQRILDNLAIDQIQRHIFLCCDQTKPKCCHKERSLESWNFLKSPFDMRCDEQRGIHLPLGNLRGMQKPHSAYLGESDSLASSKTEQVESALPSVPGRDEHSCISEDVR
jgi:hypothetical protein